MDIFYGENHQKQPLDSNGIEVFENIIKANGGGALVRFMASEEKQMAKLQRMANNQDPQEHPSQADMDLLDFYNKYSD